MQLSPNLRWTLSASLARVLLFASYMTVPATIPLLRGAWGLSAAQAGALVTAFTVSYALSLFAFAWVADYIGAKRAVALSAIGGAAASALFGLFARDYASALPLTALIGLMQGGVYTPLIILFAERNPAEKRGAAMGWLIASTSVGYAVSLMLAGTGIALGGWETAFLLTGLAPLAGAVFLLAALRPVANTIPPRGTGTSVWRELIGNRSSRLLTVGYIGHSWELLGGWSWLPALLAASFMLSGAAAATASSSGAWATAFMHLIGASAAFIMGGLSDRLGRRAVLIGIGAVSATLSITIGWTAGLPPVVVGILGLAFSFATIGDSPVLTTALTESVTPGYLGAVLAVRSLLGFGAGAVAPLAVGGVMDLARHAGAGPVAEWGIGFGLLGLGGWLAVAAAIMLPRRRA